MYTLSVQIPSNETTGACPVLVRLLISVIPICASLILVSGVTKTTTWWLSLLTTAPAANPDSQTRAPTPLPPPPPEELASDDEAYYHEHLLEVAQENQTRVVPVKAFFLCTRYCFISPKICLFVPDSAIN